MTESYFFDQKLAGWMRFIPVATFAVIVLAGLLVTVASLRAVPEQKWQGIAEISSLAQGESTRRFSAQLNENFVLGKQFAQIERAVSWTLAGEAGTAVRTGCPGWFFLSDELTPHTDAQANARVRAGIVAQVGAILQKRGIQLMVAVVPDKSRIESTHLCGLHRPARFAARMDDWIARLQASRIEVLDLQIPLQALAGERFYRTDTHWNEAGANAAALAIATRLQQLRLVDKPAAAPGPQAIKSSLQPRSGDLLRVANLDGLPVWLRPAPEITQVSTVAPVVLQSDDLFGDTGLPSVAVVGTSFSRNANFLPFLSQHLAAPVANLAKDGGDFEGAAMAYLGSATFRQEPPKVVVWEVPERMLEKPLSEAERRWLAYLAKIRN